MKRLKDLYQNSNQTLCDAFDRMVAEIHMRKQKDGLKTFILSGCEPGVGTTTIAINLAISMAKSGWRTLLIDGDMRKNSVHKRLNEETELGISDYLSGKAQLGEAVYETNYNDLYYMGSGVVENNAVSVLCSNNMKVLLQTVAEQYDNIIIDMPSLSSVVDASILASDVDAYILVTSQHNGKKQFVIEAQKKLQKAEANILGIIVNKVEASEYKHAMKNYDYFKNQKYLTTHKGKRK